MALRAKWTVRLEGLKTRLRVAEPDGEQRLEPVTVSLVINGLAADSPRQLEDCLDYAPICEWITHEWPRHDATPLLETRVNELLAFLFDFDRRVQDAWVGVYRAGQARGSARIGVERQASRSQMQARSRVVRGGSN